MSYLFGKELYGPPPSASSFFFFLLLSALRPVLPHLKIAPLCPNTRLPSPFRTAMAPSGTSHTTTGTENASTVAGPLRVSRALLRSCPSRRFTFGLLRPGRSWSLPSKSSGTPSLRMWWSTGRRSTARPTCPDTICSCLHTMALLPWGMSMFRSRCPGWISRPSCWRRWNQSLWMEVISGSVCVRILKRSGWPTSAGA